MKICLITPPSPFLLDERVFMHIGVLKVAAALEQKGHKVDFLDLSGVDNYLDVLDDYLSIDNSATVVGVTATKNSESYFWQGPKNNLGRSACNADACSFEEGKKEKFSWK